MTKTECPTCGSENTMANSIEAWCYDCDWNLHKDDAPKFFDAFRFALSCDLLG